MYVCECSTYMLIKIHWGFFFYQGVDGSMGNSLSEQHWFKMPRSTYIFIVNTVALHDPELTVILSWGAVDAEELRICKTEYKLYNDFWVWEGQEWTVFTNKPNFE